MRSITVAFAIAALGTGLMAARYWYKSSKIDVHSGWPVEPGDTMLAQIGWIAGIMENITKAAELNKLAAVWTAASVLLSAASAIVGCLA